MADNLINATGLGEWVADKLISFFSDSFLITIFKIIGVVLLFYIILLIIKALFKWKTSFNIGKIAENVEEINEKLDILINRIGYIETRQRAEEEKETEQELKEEKKKGFFRKLFGKNKEEKAKKEIKEKIEKEEVEKEIKEKTKEEKDEKEKARQGEKKEKIKKVEEIKKFDKDK